MDSDISSHFLSLTKIPQTLTHIKNLKNLYYYGNLELLNKPKVAIIGTRNPNPYAQNFTQTIAQKLSKHGIVIVSGGALGTDIIAHANALPNTIMISPASLDYIYPKSNTHIISKIYKQGLVLSQFAPHYVPRRYSFLERNKIVISLGEYVIIPQADLQSGSMQSANYALSLQKKIFVPPHHIGQSLGTQSLAKNNQAKVIWEIDSFVNAICAQVFKSFTKDSTKNYNKNASASSDAVLEFCKGNPFFEDAFLRFGEVLFEYELEGKIRRNNGRLEVL
ncbi:DNA-processing protein DprA [Helicobacter turcicus]|uniref:DNA-protecting protein DprA n=1 Tax=Helicobacter turcicus TaxID=2867412 RepID=A0ABS7JP22_9HELI|nr:DNA-processing protein DprA [Helicobacter turcicus]MBX7491120.1 DNA-protecting protein DprA [Helicobacter turcicus]MBX7545984.1 DNA-protecting protein DprA [Helicobacter turcicus]